MAKRKQKWKSGDIFRIPLENSEFGLGQVISYEEEALNSVICAFFSVKINTETTKLPDLNDNDLLAVQFVTRDLLDMGEWCIIDHKKAIPIKKYLDLKQLRKEDYIGVSVVGSGSIRKLLNAYFGLLPWDMMHDIAYFDKLLVSTDKKPKNVILSKS